MPPRSVSASKASSILTVFAHPAPVDVPAAPVLLLAVSVSLLLLPTMMDRAIALWDSFSPLLPSDSALSALSTVLPVLLPMPALVASPISFLPTASAVAPLDVSLTPMVNVLLVSMDAKSATVQLAALSVTLLFSSKRLAVFLVVDPDTTNLDSPALSALTDVLRVLQPMFASSARPASLPTTVSAMLTALLDQLPV